MSELLSSANVATDVPERFDPRSMQGESIEAEHFARYQWAAQFACGRRVLDAGCGVGYGSRILAEAGARAVVGIDLDVEAVAAASATRSVTPLTFETGDVTRIAYEDGRFDLVVCFEVIEHLEARDRALDEFRRVLTKRGLLLISSPNRTTYPPGNPHHVHEYTPEELRDALERRFPSVRLYRQHTWISSAVLNDDQFSAAPDSGSDSSLGTTKLHKLAGDAAGAELYTVAMAGFSDLPAAEPLVELAAPVELRRWDQLWHEQDDTLHKHLEILRDRDERIHRQDEDIDRQAKTLDHQARELGRQAKELELAHQQLASAERELACLPDIHSKMEDLAAVNDALVGIGTDADRLRMDYELVVNSTSWRITRPLRRLADRLRNLKR